MTTKNKAFANFNMNFNNGTFKKNHEYIFSYDTENEKVYVQTEEKRKQEFLPAEFDILFSFLKN